MASMWTLLALVFLLFLASIAWFFSAIQIIMKSRDNKVSFFFWMYLIARTQAFQYGLTDYLYSYYLKSLITTASLTINNTHHLLEISPCALPCLHQKMMQTRPTRIRHYLFLFCVISYQITYSNSCVIFLYIQPKIKILM